MSETVQNSFQVHVPDLSGVPGQLGAALAEAGVATERAGEILARHASAACVQCGITISGDDLAKLAAADSPGVLSEARLARLKKGYCARSGCNSYFYRVDLDPAAGVEWPKILESLGNAAPPVSAEPAARSRWKDFLGWQYSWKLGAGIAILLVLLLIRHVWTGHRIPIIQKAPSYQVDPKSVSDK